MSHPTTGNTDRRGRAAIGLRRATAWRGRSRHSAL